MLGIWVIWRLYMDKIHKNKIYFLEFKLGHIYIENIGLKKVYFRNLRK